MYNFIVRRYETKSLLTVKALHPDMSARSTFYQWTFLYSVL